MSKTVEIDCNTKNPIIYKLGYSEKNTKVARISRILKRFKIVHSSRFLLKFSVNALNYLSSFFFKMIKDIITGKQRTKMKENIAIKLAAVSPDYEFLIY